MSRDDQQRPRRRKLLVASVGVAAVSYVVGTACNVGGEMTSGNLVSPPPTPTEQPPIGGNLPAPPPPDASADAGDAGDGGDTDGGDAGDGGDGGDAATDADAG